MYKAGKKSYNKTTLTQAINLAIISDTNVKTRQQCSYPDLYPTRFVTVKNANDAVSATISLMSKDAGRRIVQLFFQ